jgi:hypothetical protein
MAERKGFEPSVGGYPTHDFQSCTFDHSVTSPTKRTMAEREGFEPSVTIIATMVFETIPFDHSGTSPATTYDSLKLEKNPLNRSEDSLPKTLLRTKQRWFNLGSCKTFLKEPHAPVLGSETANTTLAIRDKTIAPAHIAQGSSVTYKVVPSNLFPPTISTAFRIAKISA